MGSMTGELDVLRRVSQVLDEAGLDYMLTGSMALAYYATPRMTRDIDIVIALHRIADNDKAWRETVDKLLAEHAERIESQIKQLNQVMSSSQDRDVRGLVSEQFAQKNNEYAWLIGNTVGDYQKAIACSQKSLELIPDSWPYQDTLGRCYFAAGDLKNAVHYQRLAVAGAPYMQQMKRQLKQFEEALATAEPQAK